MTSPGRRSPPSLLPREHGAYAQIAFPLLTALALGAIGVAPLLLVAAALAVFFVHEPLIVLIGGRGGRAQRELASRARPRAILLLGFALTTGSLGLGLAPAAARLGAAIPIGLALLLMPLIFSRREKTALGELLVALALSSSLIPVALAGDLSWRVALIASAVWATAFALATVTVRGLIARAKRGSEPGAVSSFGPALSALAIAAAIALAFSDTFPTLAAIAVIPTALVALVFGVLGVHPRNLRRMGWSLVASNLAVFLALLIGLA